MKKLITLTGLSILLLVGCTKFPVSTTVGTLSVTHENGTFCVEDHVTVTLDSLSKKYVIHSKFTTITVDIDSFPKASFGAEICIPDSVLKF